MLWAALGINLAGIPIHFIAGEYGWLAFAVVMSAWGLNMLMEDTQT